ncbi:hypothetical protein BP6252_12633 [Coleophoma cylindrospora]|uniref:Yippee domain-containing protein n=1 Tax=Coleophoma cylindrospora TaxID=1849047 RepID=A0A3D8QCG6_9HELO|nr:hypothetical protein BP6252_12633 [Coleophoma cylindrospora]
MTDRVDANMNSSSPRELVPTRLDASRKRRRDASDEGRPRRAIAANNPFHHTELLSGASSATSPRLGGPEITDIRAMNLRRLFSHDSRIPSDLSFGASHTRDRLSLSRSDSPASTLSRESSVSDSTFRTGRVWNSLAEDDRGFGSALETRHIDTAASTVTLSRESSVSDSTIQAGRVSYFLGQDDQSYGSTPDTSYADLAAVDAAMSRASNFRRRLHDSQVPSNSSAATLSRESSVSDSTIRASRASHSLSQNYRHFGSTLGTRHVEKAASTPYSIRRSWDAEDEVRALAKTTNPYLTNLEEEKSLPLKTASLYPAQGVRQSSRMNRSATTIDNQDRYLLPPKYISDDDFGDNDLSMETSSMSLNDKAEQSVSREETTRDAKSDPSPTIKQSGVISYTISEDRTGGSSTEMSILLCALKQNGSLLDMAKAVASGKRRLEPATSNHLAVLVGNKIYGCKNCRTQFSLYDDIISRNFRGQHGKAFLFSMVVNVILGDAQERNMTTGRHVVRDMSCKNCNEYVGWRFDKAYETSEKYKEGKSILEGELVCEVS